jgi:competence protein ComEC
MLEITQILPEPAASLALGLTLGIPPTIDQQLAEAFTVTNLTHLAAVSGQNLTLTVMFVFGLIRLLWLRAAMVTSLAMLGIYVGLVGAEPSVTRAATLVGLLIIAPLVGRPIEPIRVLLVTAAAMAAVNPLVITRDVGFQLSFAAFAGILLLAPLLKRGFTRLPAWLAESLATVLAATLAVLPLQVAVFDNISFIGPLANFMVGIIVPVAMGLAFLVAGLSLISGPLTYVFALILYFPLVFISQVALIFASWPFASRTIGMNPYLTTVVIALELVGFFIIRTFALSLEPQGLKRLETPGVFPKVRKS